MREDYRSEVTDETLKELIGFVHWYNKVLGHEPLIVGGWAAWAYHHDLGSKDIDVVFPGAATKQTTLLDYFNSHGYKTRKDSLFDYEFFKERKTSSGQMVEVLVDAVSSDRRVIVSGTSMRIPNSFQRFNPCSRGFGFLTYLRPDLHSTLEVSILVLVDSAF